MSRDTFAGRLSIRGVVAGVLGLIVAVGSPMVRAQQPAGGPAAGAAAIVPFKIQVPDAVLSDLKERLARARFADEFPDVGWDYGTNLNYLRSLVTYWRERYDWRAQERRLNRFSQFKTSIGGLGIHFIHQRSNEPDAIPLLLLNGWPSSPVEYDKVIEPLTIGRQPTDVQAERSMSSCRRCRGTASPTSHASGDTTRSGWHRSGPR